MSTSQGGGRPPAARSYGIGALTREFGLTARTLRFYEDEGLIAPERVGTVRRYSHRDRARLQLICRGKRLGFSVKEIKAFLDLYDVDPCQEQQMLFLKDLCAHRIAALEDQLRDVRQTLSELQEIAGRIDAFLADPPCVG